MQNKANLLVGPAGSSSPDLGVIDGFVGMEGNDPAGGPPVEQCQYKFRPHEELIESYGLG